MKRPGLFGLLLFIAACVDGPTAPFSSDATGALSGCLLQPDGTPLKDATVWVSGRYAEFSATTGEDGHFRFERLPGGESTLLAIGAGPSGDRGAPDALAWKKDLTVVTGTERAFACETAPLASCIQGTVRAGAGVDAPPVEIVAAQSPLWTWSRASGSFTLRAPAGAHFDLTAGAMNLQDTTLERVLVPESCQPGPSVFSMFSSGQDEERVWVELPEMNVSVADATVALDGTHLYAAGGFSCPEGTLFCSKTCPKDGGTCTERKWSANQSNALQIFSFGSGRWTTSDQPLPTARSAAAGAIYNGKFYVTGGWRSVAVLDVYPGTASAGPKTVEACIRGQYQPDGIPCRNGCFPCYLSTVERYNIEENRWETLATDYVAQLPRRRGFHAAVSTARALYLLGGVSYAENDRGGYLDSISVYQNDDNQWADFGASLITGAYEVNACLDALHNRIYTLGGLNFDIAFPHACYRLPHRYAFDIGGWGADAKAAPRAYGHTGCATLGDFLFVPGHLTNEPTMRYDIAHDKWTVHEGPPNNSVRTALAFPYGFLAVSGGDASNAITSKKFYASIGRRYLDRLRSRIPTLSEPPVADLHDTEIPPEPTADTVAQCVLPP